MENTDEEDDLQLVKTSAGLLAGLETSLPKLLWKPSKKGPGRGTLHKTVQQRDLSYVINLVCHH
jgi:tubulin-specific chaperone D